MGRKKSMVNKTDSVVKNGRKDWKEQEIRSLGSGVAGAPASLLLVQLWAGRTEPSRAQL